MFQADNRHVRFELPLPDRNDKAYTHHAPRSSYRTPKPRTAADAAKQWEQACRTRWRALALVIKAKLEAVASGITTFESEFLAHIVLPDGRTVGGWIAPQLAVAYERGGMPPMLALPDGETNE
jgi:hypothetical protein